MTVENNETGEQETISKEELAQELRDWNRHCNIFGTAALQRIEEGNVDMGVFSVLSHAEGGKRVINKLSETFEIDLNDPE